VFGFASIFLLKTNRVSKEKQPPVANPSTPQASNRWIVFKTQVSKFQRFKVSRFPKFHGLKAGRAEFWAVWRSNTLKH
jgi:hypothetical protein